MTNTRSSACSRTCRGGVGCSLRSVDIHAIPSSFKVQSGCRAPCLVTPLRLRADALRRHGSKHLLQRSRQAPVVVDSARQGGGSIKHAWETAAHRCGTADYESLMHDRATKTIRFCLSMVQDECGVPVPRARSCRNTSSGPALDSCTPGMARVTVARPRASASWRFAPLSVRMGVAEPRPSSSRAPPMHNVKPGQKLRHFMSYIHSGSNSFRSHIAHAATCEE